jgi:dihydroorotase
MLRVLEYARSFHLPVFVHAEDHELRKGGVIHEGALSFELGLAGIPREAEIIAVSRDLELARRTKAHLHLQHITTKESLELIRRARADGVHVTCEVTPHHLFFSHHHLLELGPLAKVAPPLREPSDVKALREALMEGVVDCIASDHAPHAPWEKELPWEEAPFGVIGVETLLYAVFRLVEEGVLTWQRAFELTMIRPRELLGYRGNPLSPGASADFFLFDPDEEWVYDARKGYSKSQNSLFSGVRFKGRVVATVVAGIPRYDPRGIFQKAGLEVRAGVAEEKIEDLAPRFVP